MCPDGAKVRLNMGITERRYRNWDAALGHYLRARELAGEGFCEPDYWIGVTRINQGDEVALGAEVRPTYSCNCGFHANAWAVLLQNIAGKHAQEALVSALRRRRLQR